jgi:hypothetical protein
MWREMTYYALMTPKCRAKLADTIPNTWEVVVCWDVFSPYMNMMVGWTEEECDSVIYLIDKERWDIANSIEFKRNEAY